MKKIFVIISLLLSCKAISQAVPPLKIFDRGTHFEVGLFLGCYFNPLSTEVMPNPVLVNQLSHFDILFSTATPTGAICSPLPPEFADQARHYFNLGSLNPGTYTITASYVENDQAIPAVDSPELTQYDQLTFSVPYPVPATKPIGLLLLMLVMVIVAIRRFILSKSI